MNCVVIVLLQWRRRPGCDRCRRYLCATLQISSRQLRSLHELRRRVQYTLRWLLRLPNLFISPPPTRSRVLWWPCLFVCLSVRDYISGNTCPIFTKFFAHVSNGHGSVLFRRRSDTLCTSGFMDDVIFAHKPRQLVCRCYHHACLCVSAILVTIQI